MTQSPVHVYRTSSKTTQAHARAHAASVPAEAAPRIIRLRHLVAKLGIGRTTIYNKLDNSHPLYDALFPRPVRLSKRAVGWVEAEADAYLQVLVLRSREVGQTADGGL